MNKILFIFEDSRFGGPHEFTLNLIKNIKKEFLCRIYYSDKDSLTFIKKIKSNNIISKKLKICLLTKNIFMLLKYFFNFPFDLFRILKVIKKENPKCVYITNGFYSIRTILACAILKKKFVFHFHDTYCNFIFYKIGFFLSKLANCVIFSSYKSFKFYRKFFKKKKKLIVQSGVVVEKYFKYQDNYNKKFFHITTVGNISPVKNLKLFFEIAKLINIKNVKFNLIGRVWSSQKNYYETLKKEYSLVIKQKVKIFHSMNDIKKFHKKKTDLYLCTSLFESSPVAVWEALSLGIPIISTDVGDLNKLNNSYKFGVITKSFSAKKISNFISKLYNEKKKLEWLSANSSKFAAKELDIKVIAKRICEFLKNV